jgi:hypothetical protein
MPSVDVMVNASVNPKELPNCPTVVQLPGEAHDTELNDPLSSSFWVPAGNCARRAVSHTPLFDVMVNAS